MDYQKIYNQIVERAKNRKLNGYLEKHHIIPKCIGGEDIPSNLVKLTAREHFLCHMLLCEIYPTENKLKHALFLMAMGKQKIKEKHYVIGSRVYERLRIEFSKMLTGKKHTQKTCDKKSKAMLEVWANKSTEEKKKIGKAILETKKKNGNNKCTPSTAKKISDALKGREITWDRGLNKPVLQFDKQNNFITEYPSISEAERQVGGDIKGMLAGRHKTAAGYVWKYKN